MKKLLFALSVVVLMSACKKDSTNTPGAMPAQVAPAVSQDHNLIGVWVQDSVNYDTIHELVNIYDSIGRGGSRVYDTLYITLSSLVEYSWQAINPSNPTVLQEGNGYDETSMWLIPASCSWQTASDSITTSYNLSPSAVNWYSYKYQFSHSKRLLTLINGYFYCAYGGISYGHNQSNEKVWYHKI